MGSYATYLKLTNNTGKKVTTSVSEVNSYDWDGVSRPDKNYNGISINPKGSVINREELNSDSRGAWYKLTLTFDNGDILSFKNDQYDARNGIQNPRYYNPDGPQAQNYLLIQRVDKDNAINEFTIAEVGWMKNISDDRWLSELSIPGSHDSAALYDYLVQSSPVYEYNAKDQFDGLAAQLNYGIRFFDIRLRVDNGRLEAWHGVQQPSQDQKISFDEIVILCKDFLSQFPNECIVMSIKQEGGDTEIGEMVNTRIQQDITAAAKNSKPSPWYTDASIPKLGDVRGKIVLIRRFNLSYPLGIDAFGTEDKNSWQDNSADFSISAPNGTFRVQDFYGPPGDENGAQANKWNAVKNMLDYSSGDSDATKWYVNFASAVYFTQFILERWSVPSSMDIAKYINPKLYDYLVNNGKARVGTVVMDFVNAELAQKIIVLNR